ncbi:MAG TPA: TolC family protein [Vicinamibacteria bacterium]|nr:TolC family protein [Vicinamibacteria bacterium]
MRRFPTLALAGLVVGLRPAPGLGREAAPPAAGLTLRQAQEFALAHHPEIQAADLRAQAAGAAVREARAAYFPQVLGTATAAAAGSETRIAAPGGLNNPTVFQRESNGLLVSQLVTDFGRTSSLAASARYQAESTTQTAEAVRARVLLGVNHAFFGVLGAKALLKVAEQTADERRLLLDRVTALAKANLKSSLDVSFAEVALGEARLLLLKAQDELQAANARLATALGLRDAAARELVDEPLFPLPPDDVEELIRTALDARPELRAARAQTEAARRLASAEKAAQYPVVSAVGAVGFSPYRDDRLTSTYSAAGVVVSVPLFTGGRLSARAQEAQLQAGASARILDDAQNRIEQDVRIAWLAARTAHEALEVTRATLESASRAQDLAQSRYELGISSIVELSQAQLQKTQADIADAAARYEYQQRRADLDFQVGVRR